MRTMCSRSFCSDDAALAIDVGIGQVDRQSRIVVAQVGAQQERLHVLEHKSWSLAR